MSAIPRPCSRCSVWAMTYGRSTRSPFPTTWAIRPGVAAPVRPRKWPRSSTASIGWVRSSAATPCCQAISATRVTAAVVLDAVKRVRAANPDALYACDPVMGDRGVGLFVKPDVPAIFGEQLLPAADMTFPNAFELEQLTGGTTDRLPAALAAADALQARMRPDALVVVTSLLRSDGPTGRIEVLDCRRRRRLADRLTAAFRPAARRRRLLRGAVPRPLPQVAQRRRHPRPRRLGHSRRARGVDRRRRTADHRGAGPARSARTAVPPAARSLSYARLRSLEGRASVR